MISPRRGDLAAEYKLREDEVQTEANRVHGRDAGKLPIGHPFSGCPRVQRLPPKFPDLSKSKADGNRGGSAVPPIYVPN